MQHGSCGIVFDFVINVAALWRIALFSNYYVYRPCLMIKHCGIGRNNGLDTANHFLQFLFSGEKLMGWSQKKDHHWMENLQVHFFPQFVVNFIQWNVNTSLMNSNVCSLQTIHLSSMKSLTTTYPHSWLNMSHKTTDMSCRYIHPLWNPHAWQNM